MRDSFVFYKSFLEAAQEAPDEQTQREILWQIVECCLGMKESHDIPYPASAIVIPIIQTVTKAGERYKNAVENGKRGGRPQSVWIDRAEAEMLYADLKSWDKVAEELGVDVRQLRRVRAAWRKADKTGQNLTDTVTVTVTDTETVTSNNNKAPTQPSADATAPPSVPDEYKSGWDPLPFPE